MIAITGDVHGCINTLLLTANNLLREHKLSTWYFLGDIIDRGKGSKEVADLIISLSKRIGVKLLLGNHEDMMLSYLYKDNRYSFHHWLANGGDVTLESFTGFSGSDHYEEALMGYLPFFNNMELYYEVAAGEKVFLLTHAGIYNVDAPVDNQIKLYPLHEQMRCAPFIWERRAVQNKKKYNGYIQVFGHTPVSALNLDIPPNAPYHIYDDNGELTAIDIDTGCVYGYSLTTMLIDEKSGNFDFYSLPCLD
ncbi:MAG: metallophosphoesterase [Deferribacteraceae bacterium]|jgi:serine/threonine protein phosphatase 1|nr:metallophosphoesterase [Deferribacteraceae bacterium]